MDAAPIPPTMRAWTFVRRGSPVDVLQLTPDYPTPQPGQLKPDEVLVKVSAVGLQAGMSLLFALAPHFRTPWIPEVEFSGTVAAVGTNVAQEEFQIGNDVLGTPAMDSILRHNGVLAEYAVCGKGALAKKPEALSWEEAAGLPANGMTSVQAMELAGVKPGHKVLITAGSGGLGTQLVQVARALVGENGTVVTTCSERNRALVMELGADEVIDYTKHSPLHEHLSKTHADKPFDAIFDVAGDTALHKNCPKYTSQGAWFVQLGAMKETKDPSLLGVLGYLIPAKLERFRPLFLGGVPRNHRMMNGEPLDGRVQRAARLAGEGKLKVVLDSVWDLDDAKKAYAKLLTQRARGKIVIKVA